jgi:hypothetical protein
LVSRAPETKTQSGLHDIKREFPATMWPIAPPTPGTILWYNISSLDEETWSEFVFR